ncbi:hypothetical protein E2320_022637, partial [Naja naja]
MTNSSPMGAIAKAMIQACQQGLLDMDELSNCSLYPVQFVPIGNGQFDPQLEPIPIKTIRDIKQATSLYGIQAPYAWFNPNTCKYLFYACTRLEGFVSHDPDRATRGRIDCASTGGVVTTDHIFGSGAMASMTAQALLPQAIFSHISAAALRAIEKVDDASGTATG